MREEIGRGYRQWSLPESFVGKCSSWPRLEVWFEFGCFWFVWEGYIGDKFPRFVLWSMRWLTVVVGFKSSFQIRANTNSGWGVTDYHSKSSMIIKKRHNFGHNFYSCLFVGHLDWIWWDLIFDQLRLQCEREEKLLLIRKPWVAKSCTKPYTKTAYFRIYDKAISVTEWYRFKKCGWRRRPEFIYS